MLTLCDLQFYFGSTKILIYGLRCSVIKELVKQNSVLHEVNAMRICFQDKRNQIAD